MEEMEVEENRKESCENKREKITEKNRFDSLQIQEGCVIDEPQRWRTVTNDSYPPPQPDLSKSSGRRRQLAKEFIGFRVFEEIISAIVADPPPQPVNPSEYVDNFCDSKFVPFMNRTECDTPKHRKYPLHGGATVQSYYKCQLDRGRLKVRSEIPDLNQPFRRSCCFTTPPDLAFKEPTGGY